MIPLRNRNMNEWEIENLFYQYTVYKKLVTKSTFVSDHLTWELTKQNMPKLWYVFVHPTIDFSFRSHTDIPHTTHIPKHYALVETEGSNLEEIWQLDNTGWIDLEIQWIQWIYTILVYGWLEIENCKKSAKSLAWQLWSEIMDDRVIALELLGRISLVHGSQGRDKMDSSSHVKPCRNWLLLSRQE